VKNEEENSEAEDDYLCVSVFSVTYTKSRPVKEKRKRMAALLRRK